MANPRPISRTPLTNTCPIYPRATTGRYGRSHKLGMRRRPQDQEERTKMGMFKDMRDLSKAGKQMKKERGGSLQMMKDGLAQGNEALQQVQADQALAERLANEGVDGTATI